MKRFKNILVLASNEETTRTLLAGPRPNWHDSTTQR